MSLDLILVPTALEMHILQPLLQPAASADRPVGGAARQLQLCGFGPIAAAARTAQLLAQLRPRRVVLTGIAGSLDPALLPGSAWCFREAACYGIGAGTGAEHLSAAQLGWPQWAGLPAASHDPLLSDPLSAPVGDVLLLASCPVESAWVARRLLTVCAAAAGPADVELRRPAAAAAEDMEGFGVAVACHLSGVPLHIVRGISNMAGDRNISGWKITAALQAAAELTLRILEA